MGEDKQWVKETIVGPLVVAAICGGLGQFEAVYLMPLLLANAGRLEKFGA